MFSGRVKSPPRLNVRSSPFEKCEGLYRLKLYVALILHAILHTTFIAD